MAPRTNNSCKSGIKHLRMVEAVVVLSKNTQTNSMVKKMIVNDSRAIMKKKIARAVLNSSPATQK
jgi:hypothetical protein